MLFFLSFSLSFFLSFFLLSFFLFLSFFLPFFLFSSFKKWELVRYQSTFYCSSPKPSGLTCNPQVTNLHLVLTTCQLAS